MNHFCSYLQHKCPVLLRSLLLFMLIILASYFSFISNLSQQPLSPPVISFDSPLNTTQILTLPRINIRCEDYKFHSIQSNATNPSIPIYDFFIFNDEFDILEIRLFELYPYVTLFLIAESRETLSGQEKPLYLKENWSRFSKYHDKIRRIEVTLVRNVDNAWPNEHRMRNEGLRLALATLTDEKYLLLTSDTDEIPKARLMHALTHCQLPESILNFVLTCDFYYYSYEFRSKIHTHYGSTVSLIYANRSKDVSGNELRNQRFKFSILPLTCFHCTWCFNQLKVVRLKMSSYSHKEHNQEQYRTREHILDRYRHGKDLFDRHGEEYIYLPDNRDYPKLVQLQPQRFLYMTTRFNLTNAGFIDV